MKIPNNKIAHRGMFDNIKTPENSIASFKKALKYNYSIELDVQLTKDNILVVFHDFNLKRMTGIDKLITDTNYEELKKLKLLNTNEHIPTLDEVLKLINNKVLLDIEIKDTKNIKELTNILKAKLSNYSNFILKSFNPRIVRYLKNNTKYEVGYLINNKHKLYYGNLNIQLKESLLLKYFKLWKKYVFVLSINESLKKLSCQKIFLLVNPCPVVY